MKEKKIYCAGPLFNEPEREEMKSIADVLEKAGYDTFLPQRDGFELSSIMKDVKSSIHDDYLALEYMKKIIFCIDIYQLLEVCDTTVANLNGRVPDEGTVVEASCSWMYGKPTFLYKNDSRGFPHIDGCDNIMLQGVGQFKYINEIYEIPFILNGYFGKDEAIIYYKKYRDRDLPYDVQEVINMGREMYNCKQRDDYIFDDLVKILK